ncbi:hypothetical protein F4804DRAFT_348339 [Jackrogersella minutella]|nr:hypothetical protein F4804DRAFT_348339 [Jackrogersella minutella]
MEFFTEVGRIHYDGEGLEPGVSVDNHGWSTAVDDLQVRKFKGRRSHAPKSLSINENATFEDTCFPLKRTISLGQPGLDWGLGCFGNSTKLVDTGKEKLDYLYWTDHHDRITAVELFNGEQIWEGDDDWIHHIRIAQRDKEEKTEEEFLQFYGSEKEVEDTPTRPGTPEADDFLAGLDSMESACLEEESESRTAPTSLHGHPRWVLRGFRDWIEEADFIESNVSSPMGTRYYTSKNS